MTIPKTQARVDRCRRASEPAEALRLAGEQYIEANKTFPVTLDEAPPAGQSY